MSAVLDAAFNLIHDYPGGANALGPRINKASTTLSHEARRQGTAKLGLEDAVKLSVLTGDARILNAFAGELGYAVIPLSSVAACDGGLERLSQLAQEFAGVVQTTSRALADGRVTATELRAVEREWTELVAVGQQMVAHLAAVHNAARPSHLREAA